MDKCWYCGQKASKLIKTQERIETQKSFGIVSELTDVNACEICAVGLGLIDEEQGSE